MPIDRSELSSLQGLVEQVTRRLGAMAESANEEHADDIANELFAVERELLVAQRRLQRFLTRH